MGEVSTTVRLFDPLVQQLRHHVDVDHQQGVAAWEGDDALIISWHDTQHWLPWPAVEMTHTHDEFTARRLGKPVHAIVVHARKRDPAAMTPDSREATTCDHVFLDDRCIFCGGRYERPNRAMRRGRKGVRVDNLNGFARRATGQRDRRRQ